MVLVGCLPKIQKILWAHPGPTESESLQNGSREAAFSFVSRRIAHAQQGLSNTAEGEFPGVGGMMYRLQGFCFVCLFLRGRGEGVRDPLRGYGRDVLSPQRNTLMRPFTPQILQELQDAHQLPCLQT